MLARILALSFALALAYGCTAEGRRSGGGGSGFEGEGEGEGEGGTGGDVGPGTERPGEGEGEGSAEGEGEGPVIVEGEGEGGDEGEGEGGQPPTGRGPGAACDDDGQCEGGVCLNMPGGYCTALGCDAGDCGADALCLEVQDGVTACLAACRGDDDCRPRYACNDDGVCMPGERTGPGEGEGEGEGEGGASPVGGPCDDERDCEGPPVDVRCARAPDFPGGYCFVLDCEPGGCPPGGECMQISPDGDTACLAPCVRDGDCRPGYACSDDGACMPGAGGEGEGEGDGSPVGGPCDLDGDCADAEAACLTDAEGFPGGYCMVPDCDELPCPAGSECFQITEAGDTACLATCDEGCRRGYECAQGLACMPSEGGEGEGEGDASSVGGPCDRDAACADEDAICVTEAEGFPGGYCMVPDCVEGACPRGSECFEVTEAGETACLATCDAGCRRGYECVQGLACMPSEGGEGEGEGDGSPIGGPCARDAGCADQDASCLPDAQGFPDGYCTLFDCAEGDCPLGSECFQISDAGETACLATCDAGCRAGYECAQGLACMPVDPAEGEGEGEPGVCEDTCGPAGQPGGFVDDGECDDGGPGADFSECPLGTDCTDCGPRGCDAAHPCEDGAECINGRCVVDMGDGPPGPIPNCAGELPGLCEGNERSCGEVVYFEPERGDGYWNYPLNGETANNQYRSFCRRDLMMLVKHAAAGVRCLTAGWDFGNDEPIGLGDMSEADGNIPGTSIGDPGHPDGTHVDGHDMDIGYFQVGQPDNVLRPICTHVSGGREQYHCVAEPEFLDPWRTALFIGLLHDSPQLRVIGVDGRAGVMIEDALARLCAEGWLPANNPACRQPALAYEVQDTGRGWYLFHHHHVHISISSRNAAVAVPDASRYAGPDACITPDCSPANRPEL